MFKKFLLLVLLYVAVVNLKPPANRVITGKVYGANDLLPLEDVVVSIAGTHIYRQTDAAGAFKISVPAGKNTLRFSLIGYAIKAIAVPKKEKINVYLEFVPQPTGRP